MNPLDTDKPFAFTLCNPNPTAGKNKSGPWYRVSFELNEDEHKEFMDADTTGMVIECQGLVTHRAGAKVDLPKPEKLFADEKPGPWCKLAIEACGDERFWKAITAPAYPIDNAYQAGKRLKHLLGIETRKAIDHNEKIQGELRYILKQAGMDDWTV